MAGSAKRKRSKGDEEAAAAAPAGGAGDAPAGGEEDGTSNAIIALRGQDGAQVGPPLKVPLTVDPKQLETLLNKLLEHEDGDHKPYSFFINEVELAGGQSLRDFLAAHPKTSLESLEVTFKPEAWFKVLPVSRCSATMTGHSESVLSVNFSPCSRHLASGSGDTTVRIWDLNTQTRLHECKGEGESSNSNRSTGHVNWVMCVSWSPDSKYIASGGMDGRLCLWDPETGKHLGTMKAHRDSVTWISWEPAHLQLPARRLATCSKDKAIKVWDAVTRQCLFSMHSHRQAVTCVRWSGIGKGLLYSSSRDGNIFVWDPSNKGVMVKQLQGHAHWVNTLALSSEHALKTGPFDHLGQRPESDEEAKGVALARYREALAQGGGVERLVSGSDDFTLFLWEPERTKQPVTRMTGHKNLVNQVQFSPNGQWIASASFDKSVKLWNGATGAFVCSFFGHVGPVYQISWSADSRLICSGSKDSTLKLWDVKQKNLKGDLPGHADEVFTVDWSTAGTFVASGGRDHVLKLWRH